MFRVGEVVQRVGDGHQVKSGGYKIEPGSIHFAVVTPWLAEKLHACRVKWFLVHSIDGL
ncbi:hypothetical protein SDC9_147435 [bioreactor metagenome]|uniref:Uncharacterized protein n=1 Tax=bioreactor metagenome TaxID=1076179 RepID=A0A645EEC2_9ZZZZ